MIPISDDTFNNLKWRDIDGKELDKIVTGLSLIGSEPTDYPLTDGVIIYARNTAGGIVVLDIGNDILPTEDNPFYMRMAVL